MTSPSGGNEQGSAVLGRGCQVAIWTSAGVLLLGAAGFIWALSTTPDSTLDIGGSFGDPCRESTQMPAETSVPTGRSALIGWEGECPLFLWLGFVRTTWYYATDEPAADVRGAMSTAVRDHLNGQGLQAVEVRLDDTSVVGSGIDQNREMSVSIRVTFFESWPVMYRPIEVQLPAGSTTYYAIAETLSTNLRFPRQRQRQRRRSPVFRRQLRLLCPQRLRIDGTVECWGDPAQEPPPQGRFVTISAGGAHTCGVRDDGSVICWGEDTYGQSTPP